ncbi:MAG: RluA family pseudouridine synthase [Polyangia bacterium]
MPLRGPRSPGTARSARSGNRPGRDRLPFLYEDNHLLAVDKPAGMLSQGDLSGDLDVLTVVRSVIKRRDRKPGNVYLGLVHRLDRPVSGAMLLAKTSKAAGRLSRQLRERSPRKTYRALVEGRPERDAAELRHWLVRDRKARVTRVAGGDGTGKQAVLRYRILETRGDLTLLEVELITGVSHQIRVQLSALGHPVVGDRKYEARSRLPGGPGAIALHARELSFDHPVRREPISVVAPDPDGWPW